MNVSAFPLFVKGGNILFPPETKPHYDLNMAFFEVLNAFNHEIDNKNEDIVTMAADLMDDFEVNIMVDKDNLYFIMVSIVMKDKNNPHKYAQFWPAKTVYSNLTFYHTQILCYILNYTVGYDKYKKILSTEKDQIIGKILGRLSSPDAFSEAAIAYSLNKVFYPLFDDQIYTENPEYLHPAFDKLSICLNLEDNGEYHLKIKWKGPRFLGDVLYQVSRFCVLFEEKIRIQDFYGDFELYLKPHQAYIYDTCKLLATDIFRDIWGRLMGFGAATENPEEYLKWLGNMGKENFFDTWYKMVTLLYAAIENLKTGKENYV